MDFERGPHGWLRRFSRFPFDSTIIHFWTNIQIEDYFLIKLGISQILDNTPLTDRISTDFFEFQQKNTFVKSIIAGALEIVIAYALKNKVGLHVKLIGYMHGQLPLYPFTRKAKKPKLATNQAKFLQIEFIPSRCHCHRSLSIISKRKKICQTIAVGDGNLESETQVSILTPIETKIQRFSGCIQRCIVHPSRRTHTHTHCSFRLDSVPFHTPSAMPEWPL